MVGTCVATTKDRVSFTEVFPQVSESGIDALWLHQGE